MKYLKLYEDFNNEIDTKALLQDIIEMAYILEDHGITLYYFVYQRYEDDFDSRINSYEIGNSDNIDQKIKELEEYDDFPNKIWRYEIRFRTTNENLVDEYLAKLEMYLDDSGYPVDLVKLKTTSNKDIVKVIYKRHMNDLDKNGEILPNH